MEPANWAPAHCAALRDYVGKGLAFSEVADAINLKFGTNYSRSAAIGRARRMGLAEQREPGRLPRGQPSPISALSAPLPRTEQRTPRLVLRMPDFERAEPVPLRCVEIEPRHVGLIDLGRNDCRYPYGGDAEGEPMTFCGHPRRKGSSYCTPHFELTRSPEAGGERVGDEVSLLMPEAAVQAEEV